MADSEEAAFHFQVAEEMRAVLARRQVTPSEVCRSLGWTKNYLSRRLTAKQPFDVNDLHAIAKYLDMPLLAFFAAVEESPRDLYVSRVGGVSWGPNSPKYSTHRCPEISEMSFSFPYGPPYELAA
jgi:transcriptional regulator with XRE-family HTH domain